jgi:hypothetical protein
MVNQNVQEALKKFQDNKNKEYEKTQKTNKWTQDLYINTKVKQKSPYLER